MTLEITAFGWRDWTFEPSEWRLSHTVDGPVALPNKTLELLGLLLSQGPRLVAKEEILGTVWRDSVVEEGNIAFHVALLRKTLDRPGEGSCIETVRGRGYRFVAPVTRRGPAAAAAGASAGEPQPDFEAIEPPDARPRRLRLPLVVLTAVAALLVCLVAWFATRPGTPAPHPEAVALPLRAREAWRLRTPPSIQQAIALYERAIALDESYAPAYAGLADCYNLSMSGLPLSVRAERARDNAEHALTLDSNSVEAHTSRAFSLYKFEWAWERAEAEFMRAIAIDRSYATAHHWYGEMLGLLGRYDEAVAELRQAMALSPHSLAIQMDLVPPLIRGGRVAEARAVVEAAAAVNPTWHWVPRRMSEVLAAEGRERESFEEEWRAQVLNGASIESIEELRAAYDQGGRDAVLRLEIARLQDGQSLRFAIPQQATFLSARYAQLGDRENAFLWLDRALDRHEDAGIRLLIGSEYDSLRGDPEFDRILARVGLIQDTDERRAPEALSPEP